MAETSEFSGGQSSSVELVESDERVWSAEFKQFCYHKQPSEPFALAKVVRAVA